MLSPVYIALGVAVGICITAGFLTLFISLRRTRTTIITLTFASMCFLIALNNVAQLLTYNTADLVRYATLFKLQISLTVLLGIVLMWFVSAYVGAQALRFVAFWSVIGSGLMTLNAFQPYSVIFSEIRQIGEYALPWGERIFLPETKPNPLGVVYGAYMFCIFAFIIVGCVRQFFRGERRAALALGFATAFIIFTAVFDFLIDITGAKSMYFFEFGWLALVLVMSAYLSDEVVRVERELRNYQDQLEGLVQSRTEELTKTNMRLEFEVSERVQAESELRRRVGDLNTLNRVADTVATVNKLPQALDAVRDTVLALFQSDGFYLYTPSAEIATMRALQPVLGKSDIRLLIGEERQPFEIPAIHASALLGETVIIDKACEHPMLEFAHEWIKLRGVKSAMFAPMQVRGNTIGCIAVTSNAEARVFSRDELLLFENIAGYVAGAIDNARLVQQSQEVAIDAERQRLARELHDSVTQSLYSLTLLANGWSTMAETGKLQDVAGSFKKLVDVGQNALREMRLLIHQLRPPQLVELGLDGALRQRLETVERRLDIETNIVVDGDVSAVSLDEQEQLYQIAQEALNNALRHSGAKTVWVSLESYRNQLSMIVSDNGKGFDPNIISYGMGIKNMRERAKEIGASIDFQSSPGEGVTVEVIVPIENNTVS
jgi:signal transduction histidine kinase